MLEFKTVVDKNGVQRYLEEKNISINIKGFFVMAATEGGKIVGMGAVSMDPSCAVLEEIVCDDDCIAYGMAKALLNAIDLGGIKQVYIKNSRLAALAERLRFSKTAQGVYALSLEGYFTGGCEKN